MDPFELKRSVRISQNFRKQRVLTSKNFLKKLEIFSITGTFFQRKFKYEVITFEGNIAIVFSDSKNF